MRGNLAFDVRNASPSRCGEPHPQHLTARSNRRNPPDLPFRLCAGIDQFAPNPEPPKCFGWHLRRLDCCDLPKAQPRRGMSRGVLRTARRDLPPQGLVDRTRRRTVDGGLGFQCPELSGAPDDGPSRRIAGGNSTRGTAPHSPWARCRPDTPADKAAACRGLGQIDPAHQTKLTGSNHGQGQTMRSSTPCTVMKTVPMSVAPFWSSTT